jgi:Spy/CpxP family protein refolding chaperone
MIRRMHSLILVAASALLACALVAGVYAQDPGPSPRGPFGRGGPGGFRALAQLDLSEAQRQQVRDVMQRYRSQMQEAGQRLREAHDAQRAAVETTPVNEALIRSTTQTLANAQTDMALLRARVHSDIWSLLTPDQQDKAKKLRAEREARMKQRVQRRRV